MRLLSFFVCFHAEHVVVVEFTSTDDGVGGGGDGTPSPGLNRIFWSRLLKSIRSVCLCLCLCLSRLLRCRSWRTRLPSNRRLPNAAGKKKSETAKQDVLVSIALGFHSRGEKAINGGVSTIKRALPKGRARRAWFVHRGNKVGQTIANDEGQDVVNKVGRVLEAGVREAC